MNWEKVYECWLEFDTMMMLGLLCKFVVNLDFIISPMLLPTSSSPSRMQFRCPSAQSAPHSRKIQITLTNFLTTIIHTINVGISIMKLHLFQTIFLWMFPLVLG